MLDQGKDLDWFNSTEIITISVITEMVLLFLII